MLDEAVNAMRDERAAPEVEGHTCNIGTAEYNLALGERRANEVRDYLTSRGVTADRLPTVSYGEERPSSTTRGKKRAGSTDAPRWSSGSNKTTLKQGR